VTEKQADLLYAAREDCERLQGIIDDLLDLARLQAGRFEMRKTLLGIGELVDAAVAEQRAAAQQKHVTLGRELMLPGSPGLDDDKVRVDPERLRLVFANLIGNALRYTPEGGAITVRAKRTGAGVRFEVEDTGPGIPPEHQREIFHKFFRVPGSPSGGAGLGLSIAKEIVEAHSGAIGVESPPGKGCTFFFTLPLAEPPR
jgi:signal transduction histidine kinase